MMIGVAATTFWLTACASSPGARLLRRSSPGSGSATGGGFGTTTARISSAGRSAASWAGAIVRSSVAVVAPTRPFGQRAIRNMIATRGSR